MQMDVEDRLARIGVAVEDRPIAPLGQPLVLRDRCCGAHHLADERVVVRRKLVQAGNYHH